RSGRVIYLLDSRMIGSRQRKKGSLINSNGLTRFWDWFMPGSAPAKGTVMSELTASLRALVQQRARGRCEYCLLRKRFASINYETGRVVRLFNPRTDKWANHFLLEGARIVPLTPNGRVTEYLLQLNLPERVERRERLFSADRYPR